jgi:hypothetical protein
MESGCDVRLYSAYSTYWRRSMDTRPVGGFDLSERFRSFYSSFQDQLPELLNQRKFEVDQVNLKTNEAQALRPLDGAELVLFSLPFPADQIVATLVLNFQTPDLNADSTDLRRILKACTESDLLIGRLTIGQWVDRLAQDVHAEQEIPADPYERPAHAPQERHCLVFIEDLHGLEPPTHDIIAGILYGIQPPYRREFTQLERPESLNQEAGTYAAVSQTSSFFYGHMGEVENSVLLTTVQAVGTAARFQRIWRDAYYQVQQFQSSKQKRQSGEQVRKDLELLADEMGNLELDLAFSVETAADLGLGSTTSRIDNFHDDLYQVMQIKARANTVSQMFVRLSSSIRSELTAIESREKEVEENRKLRGALMLGALSFLLAPLGLVFGFFGMSASEVDPHDTMFDLGRYWMVYALAVTPMIIAFMFAVTFNPDALARKLRIRRRADDNATPARPQLRPTGRPPASGVSPVAATATTVAPAPPVPPTSGRP